MKAAEEIQKSKPEEKILRKKETPSFIVVFFPPLWWLPLQLNPENLDIEKKPFNPPEVHFPHVQNGA